METAAIACGKVMSYGDLARKILAPGAQRAVGTALGRNPFPLIIPCHRVIRSDGSLGGFGGGLALKLELLQLEGVEFDEKGRVKKKCMVR
jgi:methylated-DNA-[protein]-cysteine S-methyltransferase